MPSDYLVAISVQLLWKAESDTCLTEAVACWAVAFGRSGRSPSFFCCCLWPSLHRVRGRAGGRSAWRAAPA